MLRPSRKLRVLTLTAYLAALVAAALGHNHAHVHAESKAPAALVHAHPRATDHHHSAPADAPHEHDDCAACRFLIQPVAPVAAPPVLAAPRPLILLSTAEYLSAVAPLPRDYDSRGPPALI